MIRSGLATGHFLLLRRGISKARPLVVASSMLESSWASEHCNKRYNPRASSMTEPLRMFSTDSNENEPVQEQSFKHRVLSTIVSPQNQFYALVAGGTIGAYVLSRMVLAFTSFFTHLTPTTIAKWGFYTGFGTASCTCVHLTRTGIKIAFLHHYLTLFLLFLYWSTVLGGAVAVVLDNLYIRADPVFQYCSRKVQGDLTVQAALGDGLKAGDLRSYRLDSGRMELSTDETNSTTPVWRPPRIQMIFDVAATGPPYRTGLVTCEAVKAPSGYLLPQLKTTLLKVDYETGNEGEGGSTEGDETIFLVGSEQDLNRVSRRSGLSLDMLARAVHINKAAAEGKWSK